MPRQEADPPRRDAAPLTEIPPLALADLQLTPALLRVAGPSGMVDVEPLVMRLLLLLGGEPGIVYARKAILDRLWPATTVGDDSLHRVIALARRALGACSARVTIETVPRTGYRLVAEAGGALSPDVDAPQLPACATIVSRRRWLEMGLGLAVVGGLGVAGVALWRDRPAGRPPRSARVAALAGQAQAVARLAEPEAERQGVGLLREAVRLAPGDADLWGQMALAMWAAAEYAPPPRGARNLVEAEAAAQQALALDPAQPDARAALVLLRPVHGNWWPAEQGFRAILNDAPDHLPSLDGLSQVQAGAGLLRLHYGIRKRTVALDPLHAGYNFRSIYAHWMNGDLAAADRAGARGLELWPRHNATWNARMGLFAMTGRPERALAMLSDTATRPNLPPPYLTLLDVSVRALVDGGAAAKARGVDLVMARVAGSGPFTAVIGSMMLAALGAADRSLQVVEGFLLERGPMMVEPNWRPGQLLHNDVRRRFTNFLFTPVMAPVRALPGFAAVTQAIGLDEYWRQSGHRPEHLGA